MTRRKRVFLFGLGMLMLLWALACGGSSATPAAMTDVPVYSGATPMELGDNPLVDTIVDSVEESAGEMGSIETELYTLPAGTSWADVKSFYSASPSFLPSFLPSLLPSFLPSFLPLRV